MFIKTSVRAGLDVVLFDNDAQRLIPSMLLLGGVVIGVEIFAAAKSVGSQSVM